MEKMQKKRYYYDIELLRFIGMLLIMGHHLYLIGYGGEYLGQNCWVWVDFFFILTGAFTYRHYAETERKIADCGEEALTYTINKFKSFWPYTTAAVFFQYVIMYREELLGGNVRGFALSFLDLPYEVIYLSSSGIVKAKVAPIWFLSAMFIVFPLIVYLINKHKELWKIISFMFPIIYFGRKMVNTSRSWPNDMVRAFACIALGSFAFMVAQRIAKRYQETTHKIIITITEVFCSVFTIYVTITNRDCLNLIELLFFIMAVLLFSGVSYTAHIRCDGVKLLGEISMPMFIFHWGIGTLISEFEINLLHKTVLYYMGTIVLSVAITSLKKRVKV